MSFISSYKLGSYTLNGVSLGGLYTAFHIPEIDCLFDVGMALRSGAGASNLLLSHAHLDHIGALPSLLGMRGMLNGKKPLKLFCPSSIVEPLKESLSSLSTLHGWPLPLSYHPMCPNDEIQLRSDVWVRALKTFHRVPSLGYLLFQRVQKLKPQYRGRPGAEIRDLKKSGAPIFYSEDRPRVAYLTDTLPEALKYAPEVLNAEILILECTFLNEVKPVSTARAGCHIHIDELIEWVPHIKNKHLVLMHFSQIHKPSEIKTLCNDRLKPLLGDRLTLFLPTPQQRDNSWWI